MNLYIYPLDLPSPWLALQGLHPAITNVLLFVLPSSFVDGNCLSQEPRCPESLFSWSSLISSEGPTECACTCNIVRSATAFYINIRHGEIWTLILHPSNPGTWIGCTSCTGRHLYICERPLPKPWKLLLGRYLIVPVDPSALGASIIIWEVAFVKASAAAAA
jgi:hypothetical protein